VVRARFVAQDDLVDDPPEEGHVVRRVGQQQADEGEFARVLPTSERGEPAKDLPTLCAVAVAVAPGQADQGAGDPVPLNAGKAGDDAVIVGPGPAPLAMTGTKAGGPGNDPGVVGCQVRGPRQVGVRRLRAAGALVHLRALYVFPRSDEGDVADELVMVP